MTRRLKLNSPRLIQASFARSVVVVHLTHQRYHRAAPAFERVLEGAPEFDVALRQYGRTKFESGERREGLALVERAYAINPRPGTAYWLAFMRWRCLRTGDGLVGSGDAETIVPLALEAAEAYPINGNALELAVGVVCDLGEARDQDAFVSGLTAREMRVESEKGSLAREIVGFPALDDDEKACYQRLLGTFLSAAEEDPSDKVSQTLLWIFSSFRAVEGSEPQAAATIWRTELLWESDPDRAARLIRNRVAELLPAVDDPGTVARGVELLFKAEGVYPEDLFLLNRICDAASRIGDRRALRRLVDGIGGYSTANSSRGLLEVRARAAAAASDWVTVIRIARRLEELDPNPLRWNEGEKALKENEIPEVWIKLVNIWIDGEGLWLKRTGGVLLGLMVGLSFMLGAVRLVESIPAIGVPTPPPERTPIPDSGHAEEKSERDLMREKKQERRPSRFLASLEVATVTILLYAVVIFLYWQTANLKEFLKAPLAVVVGGVFLVGAILVWGVGLTLRRFLCRRHEPVGSRESQALAGLAYGFVMVAAIFIMGAAQSFFGYSPPEQHWIVELARRAGLTVAVFQVVAILVIPIAEEVFFRGYVFERLRGTGSLALAYILSSLIFSLVHLNPAALGVHIVQGVVLARAYHHRNSLLTATLAHIVNNAAFFGFVTVFQWV